MTIWHPVQIQPPPRQDWWVAVALASLVIALLLLTIVLLEGCAGGQCRYDARFDGRVADPDNGVYPYYLVAECPGEVTQTLVESATRLHVPR